MKISIGEYSDHWMAHKCFIDGSAREQWVDITVGLRIPKGINPKHLEGMEFDVDYTHPFVSIANGDIFQ